MSPRVLLILTATALLTPPLASAQPARGWPTATFKVLHHFSPFGGDGRNPQSGLVQARDGFLYGTTPTGGSKQQGTVYRIREDGTGYEILHHFTKLPSDGGAPVANVMISSKGIIYGTSESGGRSMAGTIWTLGTDGKSYRMLFGFDGINTARGISTPLVEGSDGRLYGMSDLGGSHLRGVLFSIRPDGMDYRILREFDLFQSGGGNPIAPLHEARDGTLFGTTSAGGRHLRGTVFKVQKDGTGYATLHHFSGGVGDGAIPSTPLVEHKTGLLYGLCLSGGSSRGGGSLYRIARDGSQYKMLRGFTGENGEPGDMGKGLVFIDEDWILAASIQGGNHKHGTLFLVHREGAQYGVLHHFPRGSILGATPKAPPVGVGEDTYYGVTQYGGQHNAGTLYELKLTFPKP